MERQAPGRIRDSICEFLDAQTQPASVQEIHSAVKKRMGAVASSSVRSYLNLNTPEIFQRKGRGHYQLRVRERLEKKPVAKLAAVNEIRFGNSILYQSDCLDWLSRQAPHAYQAVVTDPPYGLVEYTAKEQKKLRAGRGGIWRVPPSFDGHTRSPLPRFTVLDDGEKENLREFFERLGIQLCRVTVPGANVLIASNPLLMHIVTVAMIAAGFEYRGSIVRLVMTMRGGDRPKNAHIEFSGVSVLPRSMWEPWLMFRHPLVGRVQDSLRQHQTGGFRRPSKEKPFGDVIRSNPTSSTERKLAPHPSLKPQKFLREIIRAVLPLGNGVILDPFAGSGSTLAASEALGYKSIGIEMDRNYFLLASKAMPKLASLVV